MANEKPVNKSNSKNVKCEHCKHWKKCKEQECSAALANTVDPTH